MRKKKNIIFLCAASILLGFTSGSLKAQWQPTPYCNTVFHMGNVGINTSDAFERLHIKGNARIDLGYSFMIGNMYGNRLWMSHSADNAYIDYVPSLQIRSGTTAVATFLQNGNVGIGTSNPSAKFHIAGNSFFDGNVGIGTSSPSTKLHVVGNTYLNGNLGLGTSSPSVRLHVVGNTYLNGNVGIGTENPSTKLHVVGNTYLDGNLSLVNGNFGLGTSSPTTRLHVVGNTYLNGDVGIGTSSPSGKLHVVGNAFFTGTGNVGIGTTSPSAKLHVVGTTFLNGNVGVGTTSPTGMFNVVGTTILNGNVSIGANYTTSDKFIVVGTTSLNGNVGIGANSLTSTRLYVVGNTILSGNVDIGSTNSNTNLHVSGSTHFDKYVVIGTPPPPSSPIIYYLVVAGGIQAREILVQANTGADFVFDPNYHLRPLEEVEQFITENRRLPDIAPADSMVQHGVNMGEFQIQLLQKIEELTLYIIEQDKRAKNLEQKIEILKRQIEKK